MNLQQTLLDTERILFDPVIDSALLHLMKTNPKKFGFICQELITKKNALRAAKNKRISYLD